jgi:hypothetical protein
MGTIDGQKNKYLAVEAAVVSKYQTEGQADLLLQFFDHLPDFIFGFTQLLLKST